MTRSSLLAVAALAVLSACAKTHTPPTRPADNLANIERFSLDSKESLRRYCQTEGLKDCSAVLSLIHI